MTDESAVLKLDSSTVPAQVQESSGPKLTQRVIAVRRYSIHAKPACFSSKEQWIGWVIKARAAPPDAEAGYCEDCELCYQQKMIAQNRCANPAYKFGETQ